MIEVTRGDTPSLHVNLRNPDGSAYELQDGDALTFTVKKAARPGEPVMVQKVMDVYTGTTFRLEEAETTVPCGTYVYDVELRTAGGSVCTVVKPDKLRITQEVTTHG